MAKRPSRQKPAGGVRARTPKSTRVATAPAAPGPSLPATEAKNRFGEVLKLARENGKVFIERHGRHQAVVLDIEVYKALVEEKRTPDERRLDELRQDFDRLYARMQTQTTRDAIDKLFEASDEEINRAVRRRG